MNAETPIDWACWEVEAPPSDFVDGVMDAVRAEPRPFAVSRPKRSARWTGVLAAAAVAAGSLAVLAMMERSGRLRQTSSSDARQGPNVHPPSTSGSDDASQSAAASRVPTQAAHAAGTVVDRKLRDTVRARVVPPLEAQGIERDPHTGLTIPAGASGPSHNLSKEYLQARIREDFLPLALACYENALAKMPALRGQIVVDFMIVGDAKSGGIVDQAKINDRTDIGDTDFTGCIRESMLSMVFAPPENNGWVTVTYPFQFSPDDEDEEAPRDK